MGKTSGTVSGTLRFTAPSTFAQLYIIPILPRFLNRHLDLTLDLRLSDTPFDLIEGSFDLALRNAPMVDTSLKGRKLAEDDRLLCASPDYLKAHGTPIHPSDLKAHTLIAFRHMRPRTLRNDRGQSAIFDPSGAKCQLIMDDGLSQKRVTLAGAGISLNALWSVHDALAAGDLIQVLPGYKGADDDALWLIYPKSNVLSPKVRVFMDHLIAEIGKTPPWQTSDTP